MLSAMDRRRLEELATDSKADVEAVLHVAEQLARIAGVAEQPGGYSLAPPLGRLPQANQGEALSNAVTVRHQKLGLSQR